MKKPKNKQTNLAPVSNNNSAANTTASIKKGRCTRCGSDCFLHIDSVKRQAFVVQTSALSVLASFIQLPIVMLKINLSEVLLRILQL